MSKVPRILVVEDHTEMRRIMVRILARQGFEVREAEDGQRALAALSEWPADIVIADGSELLHRLRLEHPRIGRIPVPDGPFTRQELCDSVRSVWAHTRGTFEIPRFDLDGLAPARPHDPEPLATPSELDRLISVLVFEMGNPLAMMRVSVEMAREDLGALAVQHAIPAFDEDLEGLDAARLAAEHLTRLVTSLKQLMRQPELGMLAYPLLADMNNPLSCMSAYVELARQTLGELPGPHRTPAAQEVIGILDNASRAIARLVTLVTAYGARVRAMHPS